MNGTRRCWPLAGAGSIFGIFGVAATAALVVVAGGTGGGAVVGSPAPAAALAEELFGDPAASAKTFVAQNPSDPRTPLIATRIASQPVARWFTRPNLDSIESDVAAYVSAAGSRVPVLVTYTIPNRDCGGASAGGFTSLTDWSRWMESFARGLGSANAIVIVEPDALALQTCLSADEARARNSALARAVATMKATAPNSRVFLDAGHSAWNPAATMAERLRAGGIAAADGFYTNPSNFQPLANEKSFGRAIQALVGADKLQVIDTSRNGRGPLPGGAWCYDDNVGSGQGLGVYPTLNTGDPAIGGYLWIKPPGEADGCANPAGSFVPAQADELARNAVAGDPPTTGG